MSFVRERALLLIEHRRLRLFCFGRYQMGLLERIAPWADVSGLMVGYGLSLIPP